MGIETLPLSLIDAMEALKSDPVIANVLGGTPCIISCWKKSGNGLVTPAR